MTSDDIEAILSAEEIARTSRSIYTKKADIANFRSALRKYKSFSDGFTYSWRMQSHILIGI